MSPKRPIDVMRLRQSDDGPPPSSSVTMGDRQTRSDDADDSNLQNPAMARSQPLFLVPLGRGNRGKTLATRWFVERAHSAGRQITIADGDRTNRTLSSYFEDAKSPPTAEAATVTTWFESLINDLIEKHQSLVVDFGAGDITLRAVARDLMLHSFLLENGIVPVALHFMGPDPDDLAYLRSFEDDDLFAPDSTIIVFNEFSVPPRIATQTAFSNTVQADPVIKKILDRGGEIVVMPPLACAHEIDRHRIGFLDAMEGRVGQARHSLSPVQRQQTAMWLRRMDTAFAHVVRWLP